MSATSAPRRPALTDERRFYLATAGAALAATLAGFAPTWFLMRWFEAPPLPLIVHVHGAVFTAWVLLYLVQAALISGGRRDLHQAIGIAGTGLAAAMIVLGVVVGIEGARRGAGGPGRDQQVFLINPLANTAMFGALLIAAIRQRKRAPYHKRLMLLAMLPVLTTPFARISQMLHMPVPPPVGGMALSDLFLVALAIFDLRTRGRLHPATLWGGGFLLLSQPLRVVLSRTEAWKGLAALLIG